MSGFINKNLLGDDADAKMMTVAKSHRKKRIQEDVFVNNVYRSVLYFSGKLQKRMERFSCNKNKSEKGTYNKRRYWYRDFYDRQCSAMVKESCKTEEATPLIQRRDVPDDIINLIQAILAEVFQVPEPRDFQYEGAHQYMFRNDTVIVVSQETASGKTLIVQLTSFGRRGLAINLEPLVGLLATKLIMRL